MNIKLGFVFSVLIIFFFASFSVVAGGEGHRDILKEGSDFTDALVVDLHEQMKAKGWNMAPFNDLKQNISTNCSGHNKDLDRCQIAKKEFFNAILIYLKEKEKEN